MPTTFANTIDGNEILAKRSQCDYAGDDIQTTYATKSEVTTGLSGKQDTISDLSDIRAGAEAGATAVQDAELAAGLATKQDTINDLSTIRSGAAAGATALQPSDVAEVAVSGNYADLINKPTIPSGPQLVPSATSADADKVLKVNAQGTPEWATGGGSQVQADWAESDSSEPSYIENKPVPKTLTAGTGISITENQSTITIANTATPPTVDQSYDASSTHAQSGAAVAEGISDAIGDLPTNLTSAQIQALKEALGVDETVLYSGVKTNSNDGSATYTLSELPTNFQYIEVQYSANDNTFAAAINGNCGVGSVRWDTTIYQAYNTTVWLLMNGSGDLTTLTNYTISANFHNIRTTTWSVQGFLNAATTNAKWFHINKIIGIHRIANN